MEFIDLRAQQSRIREEIDRRIAAVLDHGRYVMGPEVDELEERLAEYVGVAHCIGVASGTDSLLIALMALGIGRGDEVITVPYTWISTAEMIALLGATPVFVDVERDSWNMDPSLLESAITEKTRAILPVSIYGQPADMTAINAIASRNGNLPVIEDAAQSFGSTHQGRRSCSLSTIGSTSFFPSKPLGCYGEGGALFTNDDEIAAAMRRIRNHGQEKRNHHPVLGINGRLDTIQAAILLAKLDLFDEEVLRRQEVAREYTDRLNGLGDELVLPTVSPGNTSVYAQYTILSPHRALLQESLKAVSVPSVGYYTVPLHLQRVFGYLGHSEGDFPITEWVSSECLSLPMNPYFSSVELTRVVTAIQQAFAPLLS